MKRPLHKVAHSVCPHANWAACDKAAEASYRTWGYMQQVILAYNIVVGGRSMAFRKEKGLFAQLVQLIAGDRDELMNDEGNPSESRDAIGLREAIERFKAGDLPGYNLYEPTAPSATTQEA